MSRVNQNRLPQALARLHIGAAPHLVPAVSYTESIWTYIAMACLPLGAGLAVYGLAAARVVGLSMVAAVLTQRLIGAAKRQPGRTEITHSAMMGMLLGLTLPAATAWYIPIAAGAIAVAVGKVAFGGIGHYFWHPAALGRIAVQVLFPEKLSPDLWTHGTNWPFLARGHLLTGDLSRTCVADHYVGWQNTPLPGGFDAWLAPRPEQILRWLADGRAEPTGSADHPLLAAIRDALPPWQDTVLGLTGGGIGEGCAIALMVAAIYLMYRHHLRWQIVVGVLTAAAAAAAVLPIRLAPEGSGDGSWLWLPVLAWPEGLPAGPIYVLYHLTCGDLMLVACLLAGETVTNPITPRGQIIFALALGALTVFLRMYALPVCAGYWALLAMNTVVPLIDRRTQPRVLGT
ncbi:MAG TPA: RnfABCDGE type electron transport complex subunit D [Phycisphaerae bacterium]|nr:RnfABCDGE type electron transport complex subunit D [Phycisphaerae bacterium]